MEKNNEQKNIIERYKARYAYWDTHSEATLLAAHAVFNEWTENAARPNELNAINGYRYPSNMRKLPRLIAKLQGQAHENKPIDTIMETFDSINKFSDYEFARYNPLDEGKYDIATIKQRVRHELAKKINPSNNNACCTIL